ncbi:MetQ/NlpA family ABC transporter substrate-binding protein [Lactobacillus sp. ESL0684]|uniref:MetQ/NlpA family ABC transporter substrate-binding protein n=1 Tax=Lactobacillus sp. ESL0684 TaxID=2983213 RepID=UPI0023F8FF32|nr:MetQ/NlpA family ABC transporter substrate-binding protein [Lactobacillus sp. ESL0684]WEV44396.1 MetQ/NlpA family ABC transporter substrate-binding protein [Lactobacillus sp. ESL0684]
MTKKLRRNIIIIIALLVVIVAAWFSLGPGLNKSKPETHTVTVGLVSEDKGSEAIWKEVASKAKRDNNIIVKVKNFTDYNQPNKALKSGDIDLNSFQHLAFLKSWNKANHGGIVPIGRTEVKPISLYSKKYKKLSQLPKGATIAIPNDATNGSRSLIVLKNAGLIRLGKDKDLVTVADITENPHNFKIKEVSAEQCGRMIDSVDAAVVNSNFARPAGLGDKEKIFTEPFNKDTRQWINVICARKADAKNKDYQAVVKAYQTAKTKQLDKKYYGNDQIPVWDVKFK